MERISRLGQLKQLHRQVAARLEDPTDSVSALREDDMVGNTVEHIRLVSTDLTSGSTRCPEFLKPDGCKWAQPTHTLDHYDRQV
jgi:hypothetical protein